MEAQAFQAVAAGLIFANFAVSIMQYEMQVPDPASSSRTRSNFPWHAV